MERLEGPLGLRITLQRIVAYFHSVLVGLGDGAGEWLGGIGGSVVEADTKWKGPVTSSRVALAAYGRIQIVVNWVSSSAWGPLVVNFLGKPWCTRSWRGKGFIAHRVYSYRGFGSICIKIIYPSPYRGSSFQTSDFGATLWKTYPKG